ncbi:MAG: hypothetical protein QXV75_07135 [Candidatus Bathyarchaeia archaeon]
MVRSDVVNVNIPLMVKLYKNSGVAVFSIPSYIAKTFDIRRGDVIVFKVADVRMSGIVSGSKRLVYIRKNYMRFLNDQIGSNVEIILESVYRPRGGDANAEEVVGKV